MNDHLRTRRHFFRDCGIGVGKAALASLLAERAVHASDAMPKPHFAPKATSVIYLFMAGGPSQLDLFDYKPKLNELEGQPIPPSVIEGKRFAFMDTFNKEPPKLLGTSRKFARHGQCGAWVSELFPHTATVVDDLTFLKTVTTEQVNHAPAKLFANTGSGLFGRPSMGSWVTYGIGSEAHDLPGFVVLQSGPRGPRGGAVNWGSGFLPTVHQGVPFRSGGEPILSLTNPPGFSERRQGQAIGAIEDLNRLRLDATGDPEIATRIRQYELAFKMQASAPKLIDFSDETNETLSLYGITAGQPSYAANCLLARRMVERGVRFVQLYHTNWDHHGGPGEDLQKDLDKVTKDVDQANAALVTDLKRRGLLDRTLVVWGGEFGRTPMGERRDKVGRNHHIDASTMWLAGGGTKPGVTVGATDDFGYSSIEDRLHVHDVQATILHLLGLDHTKLTYRFQGRDFRLTDVAGKVIHKALA
ncbi:MAG: DUF1501 domain-containing protein [Gemmataceae bacterium]